MDSVLGGDGGSDRAEGPVIGREDRVCKRA